METQCLTSLIVLLLACSVSCAPVNSRSASPQDTPDIPRLMWSLHRGVTATYHFMYINGLLLAQPEEGPSHNISDGLCQFLMYYNFLKLLDTNSTESLEALLRENLRDGCRVLTAINNTSGGVNVTSPYDETVRVTVNLSQAAEGASCDPDHGNYLLHHVCTKPSITNSNLVSAIQNIVNSFAVEGEEGACDWINQSLPDPHRLAIYEGINCSTR